MATDIKRLRREIMKRHADVFVFDDDGELLEPPRGLVTPTAVARPPHRSQLALCRQCGKPMQRHEYSALWRCLGCDFVVTDVDLLYT